MLVKTGLQVTLMTLLLFVVSLCKLLIICFNGMECIRKREEGMTNRVKSLEKLTKEVGLVTQHVTHTF